MISLLVLTSCDKKKEKDVVLDEKINKAYVNDIIANTLKLNSLRELKEVITELDNNKIDLDGKQSLYDIAYSHLELENKNVVIITYYSPKEHNSSNISHFLSEINLYTNSETLQFEVITKISDNDLIYSMDLIQN